MHSPRRKKTPQTKYIGAHSSVTPPDDQKEMVNKSPAIYVLFVTYIFVIIADMSKKINSIFKKT